MRAVITKGCSFLFLWQENFRYGLLTHIKGAPLPEVKILTLRVSSAAAAF